MAVNKTINKRTNTHGAMRNCIEYVLRQQVKDSFVADCAVAVLKALENCISKEKFIKKGSSLGGT